MGVLVYFFGFGFSYWRIWGRLAFVVMVGRREESGLYFMLEVRGVDVKDRTSFSCVVFISFVAFLSWVVGGVVF